MLSTELMRSTVQHFTKTFIKIYKANHRVLQAESKRVLRACISYHKQCAKQNDLNTTEIHTYYIKSLNPRILQTPSMKGKSTHTKHGTSGTHAR